MLSNKLKLNNKKKKKNPKNPKAMLDGSHQSTNLTKAESIQTVVKKHFIESMCKKSRCMLGSHSVNGPAQKLFVPFSKSSYEADCIHT